MSWTTEEYKTIEEMAEHAVDTTYYKIYCSFCSQKTKEKGEYPSTAAEEAWNRGYRFHTFKNGETYVACPKCIKEEKWKEWED